MTVHIRHSYNIYNYIPGKSTDPNYQFQLQNIWQKCWSQNAAMMQGVRYRERGPMKSWRPETMAEAIWAVLQEGICFFNFLLGSICILRT